MFSVWTFLSYRGEGEGVEGTNMLFYLLFIDLLALSAAYVCVFFFFVSPVSGTLAFLPPSHSKKTKTKKKGKRGSFFFSGGFGWEGLFLPGLFIFIFISAFQLLGKKKKNAESKVKYTRNRKRIKTALFKKIGAKGCQPLPFLLFFVFFFFTVVPQLLLLVMISSFLFFFFFLLRRHISEKYMHNK